MTGRQQADWMVDAECHGLWDAFFTLDGEQHTDARYALAKTTCGRCPVKRQCDELAEANGERWGVWGGELRERVKGKAVHEGRMRVSGPQG